LGKVNKAAQADTKNKFIFISNSFNVSYNSHHKIEERKTPASYNLSVNHYIIHSIYKISAKAKHPTDYEELMGVKLVN
jgi:hypothetical protein